MITAKHSPLFEAVFERYTENLLARRFHSVWVRGNAPGGPSPYVLALQHVSWWDPLVLFFLSRARFPRGGRHYAMMDAKNLRRYGFFRWLGAFGVDRDERDGRSAAVHYALERLTEPNARVVVFPQGRQYPMDARPLRCQPGTGWIAARASVPVVPVALRYEFLEDEWPEVFVSIGAPTAVRPSAHAGGAAREPSALVSTSSNSSSNSSSHSALPNASHALRGAGPEASPTDPVEALLTAEADALRSTVHAGRFEGFERLLRGRGERDPKGWERGGYDAIAAAVEQLVPGRGRD